MAAEGLRPILAPDTPPKLAALLEAAWQLDPAARPTAAHLEAELRGLLEDMDASPAADSIPASTFGVPEAAGARDATGAAQNGAVHAVRETNGQDGAGMGFEEGSAEWGTAAWEQLSKASTAFQPKARHP